MSPATFFRKLGKAAPAAPAKATEPKIEPVVTDAASAPAAPAEPASAPATPAIETAPAAEAKPSILARPIRAARLVEAGRTRSTKLKGDLQGLLGKAEPWKKPAAAAAALLAVGGLGYGIGHAVGNGREAETLAASRWAEASAEIARNRDEALRLANDMKVVRTTLDALKADRDRSRGDILGKQAQLTLEKNMGKLGEQLEQVGS